MKKLLLISPFPPPLSGMERATRLILDCRVGRAFEILPLDSGAGNTDNDTRGKASPGKVARLLGQILRIAGISLFKRPHVALTPLAQNRVGFIKCGLFILTASLFRVPVVTWMGGAAFGEFHKRQSPLMRWFIRLCLGRIHRIVIRGYNQAGQFNGLFPSRRLTVVYNPSLPAVGAAPRRPLSPKGPVRLLFMALVSKAKGALDVLEAVGRLREAGIDATATLGGDFIEVEKNILHVDSPGSTTEAVQELTETWNLEGAVRMPGFLGGEEKKRAFAEHDIFLFPSYSEGAPFSVLEAVASGIPIVGTRVGNLPELLEHGRDILYCGFGKPGEIAENVRRLLGDPALAKAMPVRARRSLDDKCALRNFEERMIRILNEAAR